MRNSLFNKRIPTLLGILLVLLGILVTTYTTNDQTTTTSIASNSEVPRNIKISNLSGNSFTVTYQTDTATTGSINYGKDNQLGNTELDDIDKEKGIFASRTIHSISIGNLSPQTTYHFVIVSGRNTFLNKDAPYEATTGPSLSQQTGKTYNIKGKVLLPNGTYPSEAVVYLNSKNSQLLSTVVRENGDFNFSINRLRSEDLFSFIELNEFTVLQLAAMNNFLGSSVLISLDQANSLPKITLSNNYDFTNQPFTIASGSAKPIGFPTITTVNKSASSSPKILTPQKDQSLSNQKPKFTGTSLPNETIEITIHSEEEIQAKITSDKNGNWTFTPPQNLSPGTHTITIKTKDSSGILKTIVQSFVVEASEGTGSASLSTTPTETISPTSTPTPTLIPSPTKSEIPIVGDSSAITPLIIGGIAAVITGIGLFLLTYAIL